MVLKISQDVLQEVMNVLGQLPHNQVRGLIDKVQEDVSKHNKVTPPAPKEEKPKK